jgi:diguanylate cyclase (GGDEF)-like protein
MPSPRTEQGSAGTGSSPRLLATLGIETTILAVLVMIAVVGLVVADEERSASSSWLGVAVVVGAILLALDWFQRRRMKRIAVQATEALVNAQADVRDRERTLQNTLARQAKIVRLAREIGHSGDQGLVALSATRAASAVSGAKHVSLWVLDQTGESMRLLAEGNWEVAHQERGRWLPVGEGAIGAAIAERQPIGVPGNEGTTWVWPLQVANRIIGVMELVEGPVPIDDVLGDAVSALATQAASSLEAARLWEEARELSRIDPLTKLPNRQLFDEDLDRARELARRHGHSVSVLIVDLDEFARINETYGHPYGDEMLVRVAEVLAENLRRSDTAYRIQRDEFAVLARETNVQGATTLAERLRTAIEAKMPRTDRGEPLLTASIGVAELGTREPDVRRTISAADAALLDAKRGGRNRVVVTDTSSDPS